MLLTTLFWALCRAALLSIYSCTFHHLKVGPDILPFCLSNQDIMYTTKNAANNHASALRCNLDPPATLSASSPYAQYGKRKASIPYTTLHEPVKSVDRKAFEAMLKLMPKNQLAELINQKDKDGYTPLLWCLDLDVLSRLNSHQKRDYLYILKCLLHHPSCDVFVRDNHGKNMLHWAVINKYEKACQAIFNRLRRERGGEVKRLINQTDCFGYHPLHYLFLGDSEAYSEEHSAILQQFLDHDLCDINAKDADGLPVLYWLIQCNHPNLAKKLLESGRLETFTQFIWKQLNEYYAAEPINRFRFWKELSSAVREILSTCVKFLADSGPDDPNIHTKKLLLTRYFCLDQYNYNKLYTNDLVKKLFNEQIDLILALYKFGGQIYPILGLYGLDMLLEQVQNNHHQMDCDETEG